MSSPSRTPVESSTSTQSTGSTTISIDSEAGPSRARRSASPIKEEPTASPPRPTTPLLDLATYPTTDLLRLLANLLQQIAEANDHLRPDYDPDPDQLPDNKGDRDPPPPLTSSTDDTESNTSHAHSNSNSNSTSTRSSTHPHPSPTTALFSPDLPPVDLNQSTASHTPHHLFTASKTCLSDTSSLLSFHARHIPSISIEAYLLRILKYCPTTNEVFLGLLVYFDRMSKLGTVQGVGGVGVGVGSGRRGFAIDSFNVHRLVIAGVTVASKFFSDVFYTNSRYAKVGGLPPHELNQLELQFLLLNDFRLVIPREEMQRYGDSLLGNWESGLEGVAAEEQMREKEAEGTIVSAGSSLAGARAGPTEEDAREVTERSERMEVDRPASPNPPESENQSSHPSDPPVKKERDTRSSISESYSTAAQPPPPVPQHVAPRGREWITRPTSISFAPTPSASSMRGFTRSEGAMGSVMGHRMASPVRD